MIPTTFEYVRAKSVTDALKAIAGGTGAKVIAGGHSLIPLMRFRLAQPEKLVDIAGLADLKGVSEKGKGVRIGAATTYRELLESKLVQSRFPILAEATAGIGDLQVRNRGTIGGGIAHADPASDMPAVMLALGATFNLRSKAGKRSVEAGDFFEGTFATALKEGELLIDIVLPRLPSGAGSAYVSFEQPASGYALAGAAAVVKLSRKTVSACTLALTGLSDRAFLVESAPIVGSKGEPEAVANAVRGALAQVDVNDDIHASADYRRHLAVVVAQRAVAKAMERVG